MDKVCFLTDLDNTLIYSKGKIKKDTSCVEYKQGDELSYMKTELYDAFCRMRRTLNVVPITTRSLEQYGRITLFHDNVPKLALIANGGILLRDGVVDRDWLSETRKITEPAQAEMEKAHGLLAGCDSIDFEIRNVDDLFLFTKSAEPKQTIEMLRRELDLNLISCIFSLKKIYVFPKALHKGLAAGRLREHLNGAQMIAAGDSAFDYPLLLEADIAIGTKEAIGERRLEKPCFLWEGELADFSDFVLHTVERLTR